jgi:serine/threonine protein kinase
MYDSKMPDTQTSSGPAIIEVSEQALQTSAQAMVESVPAIPSSYTLVSEAGEGAYATACFCLPTQAVIDAVSSTKASSSCPTAINTLKSKLQVIKVFNDPGRLARYTEVNILVDIQQHRQSQSHAQPLPIIEILAWDTTGGVPAWIATSTFPVLCDLEACRGTDMPEEFVWHVYTQLHAALAFLHKSARIIHRDLHDGNVIVGYSNSTGTGLPQVKVIDFGMAEQLHSNSNISKETYAYLLKEEAEDLLIILDALLCGLDIDCAVCAGPSLDEREPHSRACDFHDAVGEELARGFRDQERVLDRLWERFGSFALGKVKFCSDKASKRIRDAVFDVTLERREENDSRVQEILGDAERAASTTSAPTTFCRSAEEIRNCCAVRRVCC